MTTAPAGSAPVFLRDGQPWDLEARKRVARESVAALRRPQPRGLPRPPGPPALRTLAGMLRRTKGTELFGGISRDHPRIAHVRIGPEHIYVLSDPDLVVQVLLTEARHTTKGRALQQAKALLGEGLLTAGGELHRRQRSLVMPAFHRARIAGYAALMVEEAVAHRDAWQRRIEAGDVALDMAADMSALTLAIVGRTLFGADLSGDAADVGRALTDVLDGFDRMLVPGARVADLLRAPWVRDLERATGELDAVVARLITEHRASGDTGDLLSMLLASTDEQGGMADAQVRDETMTLVLAGHETTAMALTWAWHLLDANPAEAGLLRDELASLDGRPPTFEDLPALPRTRAVVAETLRVYPPAWILGRSMLDDLEVDGWTVPAGSIVLALPWALHRDGRFWPEPLAFRPGRWLDVEGRFDEGAPGQPRGSWFPFGWGSRRCIGDQFAWTEAMLLLATLAPGFAPTLAPGHRVDVHPAVTLRPEGGMPMRLRQAPAQP
ncbi:MAG: cytochrome P450 [Candidatus Nanopelagicales bacterium]|jgi:cytochrome P450|nr:cytochrome P450 [Candidatus Nanopelagicales bacterium]MCU0301642.1 cytochrome P450 [Candidatus Nanopelagicales bacterium]